MESSSFPVPSLPPPTRKNKRFSAIMMVALLLVGLVIGTAMGYAITYADFNQKLTNLQTQVGLTQAPSSTSQQTFILNDNVSLSSLYSQVKPSVVVIQDLEPQYGFFGNLAGYSLQQGSGFLTKVNNQIVIVTNNHVIVNAINITVTFSNGDAYPAKVLGSDPQADLAVLSISPMPTGVTPLTLANSDALQVGDPVVAVGSPYGLSGTLTTGVISALGRTITEDSATSQNGQTIADIIQTSTAINPGNSGGPLLTYSGNVIGITTAGISNSQGLGFAIPSNTIIRELPSLVTTGSYPNHPSINAVGTDMNYQIAQAMGTSVTYGWLVESVSVNNGLKGGNTQATILGSSVTLGGDIIIAINNQRITNTDDLLSYLEQHTLPGQTINFTVVRNGQTQTVSVTIGKA
ncbi:MAG: trypsin-like peptidase domain-containing protein [Candidatus Bathyarchaeota archaeon]|nr:trypsin-like peptidase domain-containing protein [Candidatus Bathyarchaeota archaeon]